MYLLIKSIKFFYYSILGGRLSGIAAQYARAVRQESCCTDFFRYGNSSMCSTKILYFVKAAMGETAFDSLLKSGVGGCQRILCTLAACNFDWSRQ